jgi:hypothetical protein
MSIRDNLKNLKQKLETQPKHVIIQTQKSEFKIYTFDLNSEIDPNQIIDVCKSYDKENLKEKLGNVNATSTEYIPYHTTTVGFEDLFSVVERKIKTIWNFPYYTYLIYQYWFSIYSKGDSSAVHHHGWIDLACVYYASVPKDSAPLVIPIIGGEISIIPKQGMLVVLPGKCEHLVPESNHDGERIVVAMNIVRDKLLKPTDNTELLKK